jgi:hypothetical protein
LTSSARIFIISGKHLFNKKEVMENRGNYSENTGEPWLSGTPIRAANVVESIKRISWGAVFAGVVIAVVVQLSLSLLGIGIGLSTIDPMTENNPAQGLGMGTAIWYVLSSLIALFAGGWVAGRFTRSHYAGDGAIHGVLTWSLVSLITFYLLTTTIGNIIGGAGRLIGNTLSTVGNVAGKGIQAAAPAIGEKLESIDVNNLKNEAKLLLSQTGKAALQPDSLANRVGSAKQNAQNTAGNIASAPQNSDAQIDGMIDQLFSSGNEAGAALDKNAIVNVIMSRTGKSRAEAEQIATNWMATAKQASAKVEQAKEQAEQKAREVAGKAARAASTAAILTFVSLLLGAIVAGFGAKKGSDSKNELARKEVVRNDRGNPQFA